MTAFLLPFTFLRTLVSFLRDQPHDLTVIQKFYLWEHRIGCIMALAYELWGLGGWWNFQLIVTMDSLFHILQFVHLPSCIFLLLLFISQCNFSLLLQFCLTNLSSPTVGKKKGKKIAHKCSSGALLFVNLGWGSDT